MPKGATPDLREHTRGEWRRVNAGRRTNAGKKRGNDKKKKGILNEGSITKGCHSQKRRLPRTSGKERNLERARTRKGADPTSQGKTMVWVPSAMPATRGTLWWHAGTRLTLSRVSIEGDKGGRDDTECTTPGKRGTKDTVFCVDPKNLKKRRCKKGERATQPKEGGRGDVRGLKISGKQ